MTIQNGFKWKIKGIVKLQYNGIGKNKCDRKHRVLELAYMFFDAVRSYIKPLKK